LSLNVTNWVMSCVELANFSILINGGASNLFKASRCRRKGYSLSPFLFTLIAEALSLLVKNQVFDNKLKGIKVTRNIILTHLLFVDNVLLFDRGMMKEWEVYKGIITLYYTATCMVINPLKPFFLNNVINKEVEVGIVTLLPYAVCELEVKFKYLGYFLKLNCYSKKDEVWLVKKIEAKIGH
jgi:hypothetical protein